MPERTRLFADVYSCTAQRDWVSARARFRQEYVAQLRFDALASQTIVLPDIYLIDGRYFLDCDPAVRKQLARDVRNPLLPFEIRTRKPTLRETLHDFLFRKNSEFLNAFPFNSIADDKERHKLAIALSRTRQERLRKHLAKADGHVGTHLADFIRTILRENGLQQDAADRLEEGWSRWLEAEDQAWFQVSQWDAPFDLAGALTADPVDDDVLVTTIGRSLHNQIQQEALYGNTLRSDVTNTLAELRAGALTNAEALDLATIEDWYTHARHRALAIQHDADFAQTQNPELTPIGPLRRLASHIEQEGVPVDVDPLVLPDDIFSGLERLADEDFAAVCTENSESLHRWWLDGNTSALRRAVDRLQREVDRAGVVAPNQAQPTLIQVIGAAAFAGIAEGLSQLKPGWAAAAAVLISASIGAGRRKLEERSTRLRIVEHLMRRHAN
jgi:hypothetical protein